MAPERAPTAARIPRKPPEQLEQLLRAPGDLAAWAILAAVALAWLASIVAGLGHEGLTARDRIYQIFGVGNYYLAFALLLALLLAVVTPVRHSPADDSPGTWLARGGHPDQRLLLVLTVSGLVVAASAVILFVTSLTDIGDQPNLSISGAIADLAAIPVALIVTLWAGSLVSHRPAWTTVGPLGAPAPADPPSPPAPPDAAPTSDPRSPGQPPQNPPSQNPPSQDPPSQAAATPPYGEDSEAPDR